MDKKTATIPNLLPNMKSKLQDGHILLMTSFFYKHPAMLNPNGWQLLKIGNEKLLVDTDTLFIIGDHETELVWDKDHVTHVKLTSTLEGEELKSHWESLLKYANDLKKDMSAHYSKDKVDDLTTMLKNVSVDSCEDQNDKSQSIAKTQKE